MSEETNDETTGTVAVTHANQLRSAKFKELMRKKSTWAWLLGLSILGGILGALVSPVIGLVAFVVVFLIVLAVVFGIADNRAEDAFYDYYCQSHGLTRSESPAIAELTPLLRKGDKSNTDEVFTGQLIEGVEGDVVLYTYTEVHRDSDGDETETNYPFTLIHVEMPEIVQHMASLQVELSGFRFLDGLEDKFRGSLERVTLESEAFDKRFEVFVDKGQDPVWVRRLFSPSFIVWLAENPPKSFAFELENGHLVAYVSKHMDDTAGLERVTEVGAYVAARLLEEVAQSSPRAERELNQ
ncbi:MAG: hypothetical protein J0H66_02685 [Solirubrobacterales bacterium]|nr:hypothetical protein [Solirubrobacterales bacterium]OJU95258.1 MAG: hypothetical protein BGO23_05195 [Solirubrobacterales bacterium 67-14]